MPSRAFFVILLFNLDKVVTALSLNSLFKLTFAFSTTGLLAVFVVIMSLSKSKVAYPLVFCAVSCIISFIFFLVNGWYLIDYVADVTRFIAPFISYYVFSYFSRGQYRALDYFYALIYFEILILFLSLYIKLISVLNGYPVVLYGHYFIITSPFLFFLYVNGYLYNVKGFLNRKFGFFLMIVYVIAPFLSVSKTEFIKMIGSLLLVIRKRFLFLFSILILAPFVALNYNEVHSFVDTLSIFNRFSALTNTLGDLSFSTDSSSSARIAEVINAVHNMRDMSYWTFVFGMGDGALWYQTQIQILSGLQEANFRPDGGAHHIHLTFFAILFRNGLLGLVVYAIFILFLVKRARRMFSIKSPKTTKLIYYTLICFILAELLKAVFTYSIYGSVEFGMIVAILLSSLNHCEKKHLNFNS